MPGDIAKLEQREAWPTYSQLSDLFQAIQFNGHTYLTQGLNQTIGGKAEEIDGTFVSLVQQAYKSNGVVFACMLARMQLFTEARFQFQELRNGRPGKLFGDRVLSILEHPFPNGVTGDLLARAIQDADLGGNWFATRRKGAIRRLRPDWVTIVLGSEDDPNVEAGDIDAEPLGIIYHPGGKNMGRTPVALLRSEYAHFAPIPDPVASFRGMSWLTPVLREIGADGAMTDHKQAYLLNGATPNLVVSLDKDMRQAETPAAFAEWIAAFKKLNPTDGWDKFKTMYLAGGTTVTRVGSDMQTMDFKAVQGAGETRIAAAAGVPPIIVGLSEGLASGTYSNYGQARRRFADNTMRPLWRNMAGSLETIVPPPAGSRLWYDDRDIQALAEDKKDIAEVRQLEGQQIRTLTDAGYTPESVIEAVTTGDFTRLVHTGLFSVQLQRPGATNTPAVPPFGRDDLLAAAATMRSGPPVVNVHPADGPVIHNHQPAITVNTPDVRLDAPVTVHTPDVKIDAPITVTTPELRLDPPDIVVNTPDVHVTVEPAAVTVQPPDVIVNTPAVTVEPAAITVNTPDVTVNTPDITVNTPAVTVEPPDVIVNPPDVNVTVEAPEQPPARSQRIERDAKGRVTAIVEE